METLHVSLCHEDLMDRSSHSCRSNEGGSLPLTQRKENGKMNRLKASLLFCLCDAPEERVCIYRIKSICSKRQALKTINLLTRHHI